MPDSTQAGANRAITVPFHGANLYVVEHESQPYTPMKPIITGMGLTRHGQHAKIKANARRWGVLELRIPSSGGLQDMLCMPLRKLPGWLSGIEAGKVKSEEARAKVVEYQNECDDALWQYWNDGIAVNPAQALPSSMPLWDTDHALKEVVLENTKSATRSNRPVSAVSSCPNSVRFWGRWAYPRGWPHCCSQCFQHLSHPSPLENGLGSSRLATGA